MAKNILEKIVNNEIDCQLFIQNFLEADNNEISSNNFKCSKQEFVNYFLNYIHNTLESVTTSQKCLDDSFSSISVSSSTPKVQKSKLDNSFLNCASPVSPIYKENNSFSTPKSSSKSLTLGDFLVNRRSSNKKRNSLDCSRKRIKPVNLNNERLDTFQKSSNSFNFDENKFDTLPLERHDLVEEKKKIVSNTSDTLTIRKFLSREFSEEVLPDLSQVTFKKQLDFLIEIYTVILNENFVINLNSEIIFLIGILMRKRTNDDDLGVEFISEKINYENLLKSIHNQTYFVAISLEKQSKFLKYYDATTVNLLKCNERIISFVTNFQIPSNHQKTQFLDNVFERNVVHFNSDTDNRLNFPNNASFHAFRKQRDLFYEIFRQWDQHNGHSDFNYQLILGGKIRSLLNLIEEPTNFIHLARLFKAHLINSSDNDCKLSRLKSRFSDIDEFYTNFIIIGNHWKFNRHLIDAFTEEIQELNGNIFWNNKLESEQSICKIFYNRLKKLRVLGKFLGFIETLPYKSDQTFDESVFSSHFKLRIHIQPYFDVKSKLDFAICQDSVILTLPWLVVYLSMLDSVTLSLPYYKQINVTLHWLYRHYNSTHDSNRNLVTLLLGWLFELSNFPKLSLDYDLRTNKKACGLDELVIVNQQILYLCCPHLNDVKKILTTVGVKRITPISAPYLSQDVTNKKIENQLEEAFLNGQPSSLRKTIEFVSERVASSCVKFLCHNLVPDEKTNAREKFQQLIENDNDYGLVNDFATTCLLKLKEKCLSQIGKILKEKIDSGIVALVALDMSEQCRTVTIGITKKQCLERINQWIDSHVTLSIFLKDFNEIISKKDQIIKKPTFVLPSCGTKICKSSNSISAAHLVEELRHLTINIFEEKLINNDFLTILDDTIRCFTERPDVNQSITAAICSQLVDLTILLVASERRSVVFNDIYLKRCSSIWRFYYSGSNDLFKNLLSPRNVNFIQRSKHRDQSWQALAQLCSFLIKNDLMEWENFESECTGIFRIEWTQETLNDITYFFKSFIEFYKNAGGDIFLLSFLADYCDDL